MGSKVTHHGEDRPFANAQTGRVPTRSLPQVKSNQPEGKIMSGLFLRRVGRIAIGVGASCAMATAAYAVPITYMFNGTASGRLGAIAFTNAAFLVTAVGDNANIEWLAAGVPCNDFTATTFTISGVGSGSITTPLSVAANTGRQLLDLALGDCTNSGLIWISGYASQVSTYNLNASIGPLSLGSPSAQAGVAPETSSGALTITEVSALTFQSAAGYASAPVVGLWWNPSESGSGYNFDVKNGVLVATIYSYKGNGEPQWYITSGPIVNNHFTGTINKYVGGQCISCSYTGLPTVGGNDGVVTIDFSSPTSATLSLPGGRVIQIQPQAF
jgi:hypothetical protein